MYFLMLCLVLWMSLQAFVHLGLRRHHAVGILGHNAPEWHLSSIAAVVAGGLATGIYATNSQETVRHIVGHSRADVVVVADAEQAALVGPGPRLVQWEGRPGPGVLSWPDLLLLGDSLPDSVLTDRLEAQAVNQPCMLVYTSGTTGNPKAVMLSQDNITWIIAVSQDVFKWKMDEEHTVSYLPLSHIAAQIIDIYLTIHAGATVWFADRDALQGSLLDTLLEVRPTRFLGVPRVYEKMAERLQAAGRKGGAVQRAVGGWAKAAGLAEHQARMRGDAGGGLAYRAARRSGGPGLSSV
jgi:long-chain-fatty-acid--CoA ligase ACSBG